MDLQNIECQLAQAQMSRYLAGEHLPEDTVVQLQKHVGGCPNCSQLAAEKMISLQEMLEDAQANGDAGPELTVSVPAEPASVAELEEVEESPAEPVMSERMQELANTTDDVEAEFARLAAQLNEQVAQVKESAPAPEESAPASVLDEPSALESPGEVDPLLITDDALAAALSALENPQPAAAAPETQPEPEPEPEPEPAAVADQDTPVIVAVERATEDEDDEEEAPVRKKKKKPVAKGKKRKKKSAIDLAVIRGMVRKPRIPVAAVGRGGRGNLRSVGLAAMLGVVLLAMSGMMKSGPTAVLGSKVQTPAHAQDSAKEKKSEAPPENEGAHAAAVHDASPVDKKDHEKDAPEPSPMGEAVANPVKSSSGAIPPQPNLGGEPVAEATDRKPAAEKKPDVMPKNASSPNASVASTAPKAQPVYEVATKDGGIKEKTADGVPAAKVVTPPAPSKSVAKVTAPVQRTQIQKPRRKWRSRPSYSSKRRARPSQPAPAPKNFVKVYE